MDALNDVYENYHQTRQNFAQLPPADATPDQIALRLTLPEILRQEVVRAGLRRDDYRAKGSGQPNFALPHIPWTGLFRLAITGGAENGYYIVLLFREDLAGCYLSLNQGYTQFRTAFRLDPLAKREVRRSAERLLDFVETPPGFTAGPINLAATGKLGAGYEAGAILSRYYDRAAPVEEAEFRQDIRTLLGIYERLYQRIGPDLIAVLPPISEDEFQAAAAERARRGINEPDDDGPLPPPDRIGRNGGGGYRRDPDRAAVALRNADFRCELDANHVTFISASSGRNFVEAHHLIPMQFQAEFEASLDVPENIVALCPNCHRLMHHGRPQEKARALKDLLRRRAEGLDRRGLTINVHRLLEQYRGGLLEN